MARKSSSEFMIIKFGGGQYGISIHIAMKIVYSIFSGKLSGLPLP